MDKPTTNINVNYDEAIFLSTAIIHTLRKLRQSHSPEMIREILNTLSGRFKSLANYWRNNYAFWNTK